MCSVDRHSMFPPQIMITTGALVESRRVFRDASIHHVGALALLRSDLQRRRGVLVNRGKRREDGSDWVRPPARTAAVTSRSCWSGSLSLTFLRQPWACAAARACTHRARQAPKVNPVRHAEVVLEA